MEESAVRAAQRQKSAKPAAPTGLSELVKVEKQHVSWKNSGGGTSSSDAFVFDWNALDPSDREDLQVCFEGYSFPGGFGEVLTPFAILTDFEEIEEMFGDIDMMGATGLQNDGLLLIDAKGAIHRADDGDLSVFKPKLADLNFKAL
jgi:hypothetical protein